MFTLRLSAPDFLHCSKDPFPQAQQIALRPTKSSDAASAAASERWMADLQQFDSCRQVVKNWSPASPATICQQTMWIVQFVQFGMEIFVDFPVPSLLPSRCIRFRMVWRTWQWPFQEPKLEVPTIYEAKFSGLCREYPYNMWPYMVQYVYFRVLKFRLNLDETEVLEGREGRVVRHQVPEQTEMTGGGGPLQFPGMWKFATPVNSNFQEKQGIWTSSSSCVGQESTALGDCIPSPKASQLAANWMFWSTHWWSHCKRKRWLQPRGWWQLCAGKMSHRGEIFFGQQLSCGVSQHKIINLPQHHRGQRGWVMLHAHFQSRTTNLALGALGALGVAVLHPCELLGLDYIAHSGTQFLLASLREIKCEEMEWKTR